MNVRVHRAVSEVDGATGMAILRAIVRGERDPQQLALLRDPRCRQSAAQIAEQLTGHWRADHLFSLDQGLKMYDALAEAIAAYGRELLQHLEAMTRVERRDDQAPPPTSPKKAKAMQSRGEEPLRHALYRMSGVDLTAIDAIGVETVSVVLSEYGPHLSQFPTEKQFVRACRARAPEADERGEGPHPQKEAEQCERTRGGRPAHGGDLPAPQPDGVGRLLSPSRAAPRRRRGRVCYRS